MKILHIIDHSLPLHSGYTFRSQNIFGTQIKRGWHPVVVTSPKHEENWNGPYEAQERIGEILYYRTGRVSVKGPALIPELRLMRALYRRILEVSHIEKPDLLHAHSPVLNAIPASWVSRRTGIPLVYEIRAFWEDAAVDHGTYTENSLKYKMVRYAETFMCRKANQVAVLCQGLKDDLIGRGIPSDKLTVVYNGVNVNDFDTCMPDPEFKKSWMLSKKKVIGFIGSFYRYEGLDLLMDAFARLCEARNDISLLLVGGGETASELKAQAQRLGIANSVIFTGRIPHDRIPGVYGLIDILAYPRYSMRLTELVTPLKPLEAMAMGKVLVASDIQGHRELIRDQKTGLLFTPGDATALSECLSNLLHDDNLRKSLQDEAYRWVRENHTWEKTTEAYDQIYTQALKL